MYLNTIKPAKGSTKAARRVGRGIGCGYGKTCGTGHKGQKSRSGGTVALGFEGGQMPIQRRLPKVGFTSRIGRTTESVRLHELPVDQDEPITIEQLKTFGVVKVNCKRARIFLSGSISGKVVIEDANIKVSKGARDAIVQAGGQVID